MVEFLLFCCLTHPARGNPFLFRVRFLVNHAEIEPAGEVNRQVVHGARFPIVDDVKYVFDDVDQHTLNPLTMCRVIEFYPITLLRLFLHRALFLLNFLHPSHSLIPAYRQAGARLSHSKQE
ncbi:MAG: hypothetical protein HYY10_01640 [Candidatus Liptonbacteria bacterium]|nr:hypothetical protein [Candidatus Liptonbacteria bacterium]